MQEISLDLHMQPPIMQHEEVDGVHNVLLSRKAFRPSGRVPTTCII
jgi:hypothetical protein